MTLHYFSLWAKGPAPAIALNHSGLEWRGVFADRADWQNFKQATPWGALPVLEVPGVGMIGHEAAILNYLSRVSKTLGGGMSARDYAASQQLLAESEDIYCALQRVQPTFKTKDKPKAAIDEFWSKDDSAVHNRTQGLKVYLGLLEKFHERCGHDAGKFTASGLSVGECKLFSTLHCLKLIRKDALEGYPALAAFYSRFGALKETRSVVESGGAFPGPFEQYFINPF